MSDLKKYVEKRKKKDKKFAQNYEIGYHDFKLGVILKSIRENQGITQEELAKRLNTKKPAISRIENHAEDIRLSTLEKMVIALGRKLKVQIV